ncbi:MAG: hypothetical protein AAF429_03550 [Pseudomonadota bacterium]
MFGGKERQLRKEREATIKAFTEYMSERFTDNHELEVAINRAKPMFNGSIPVEAHLTGLKDRLDKAKLDEVVGKNQGELVNLYRSIHDAFEKHKLIDIHRLAAIPADVDRVNQIETIIDLYNLKISRTKADKNLSKAEKDRKLQAMEHLMEQDIAALGSSQ